MSEATLEVVPETKVAPQSVNFMRHGGFVGPQDFTDSLCIIGCGAVGSNIAMLAAKMGFHSFKLWDGDQVEAHNLANQAFDVEHIGQDKVAALAAVLKRFNPEIRVETHPYYFVSKDHKDLLDGPLVIATDTMSARYDIYKAFKFNPNVQGVFEVRLAFDFGEVHVIDNMNLAECKKWLGSLKDDSEIPEGPCNLRICTTLVWLASALAVHNICNRYAALRQQKQWKYKTRTCYHLKDQLRIMSVK